MKVPRYSEIKAQEAKHRRVVMKQRDLRSARVRQRQVSLVGDGAKWRITNLPQVVQAMAKRPDLWATVLPFNNSLKYSRFGMSLASGCAVAIRTLDSGKPGVPAIGRLWRRWERQRRR